jgi:hypothetical protein
MTPGERIAHEDSIKNTFAVEANTKISKENYSISKKSYISNWIILGVNSCLTLLSIGLSLYILLK